MARKSNTAAFQFEGFENPTTTPVPDVVFDRLLAKLGEAELKALLYIIRRTFGFKKDRDPVSFNQFLRGITTKDGQVLDEGCGIRDRTTLSKALKSLEQKRIIKSEKGTDERGENVTTVYSLRLRSDSQGVVGNSYHRSRINPPPVVGNSYPQQTGKQDINYSNIRKAKSDEFASGNSRSREEEPEAITLSPPGNGGISKKRQLYKNTDAGSLPTNSQTNLRTVEGLKVIGKYRRSAAKRYVHSSPSSTREPPRGGDVSHIGQTLQGKQSFLALPPEDEEAQEAIKSYVRDIAPKLHDEAPLTSSTTRAYNLYQRAGVDLSRFFNLLYDAEKEANRRNATITKLTALGFKNRMAYFFAVLEDKFGLRHHHAAPVHSG